VSSEGFQEEKLNTYSQIVHFLLIKYGVEIVHIHVRYTPFTDELFLSQYRKISTLLHNFYYRISNGNFEFKKTHKIQSMHN